MSKRKHGIPAYFKNLGGSLKHFATDLVVELPLRTRRLLRHFKHLPDGWRKNMGANLPASGGGKVEKADNKSILFNAGAWTGKLLAKAFDLPAFPQLLDLLWQAVKVNTRALTPIEIAESRKVFGNSLPYHKIRIDEASLIAHIGAYFANAQSMGVATFHTINFTRKIHARPGNRDMAWLIHELVHVAQMQTAGSRYMGEALHAQFTDGYNYGGPDGLKGKCLSDFNREQQGDIVRDYYMKVLYGKNEKKVDALTAIYEPYIIDLRNGLL